jgi:hypothetical protein
VDVGPFFEPDPQSFELVKPCDGAFNDPSEPAKFAAVFSTAVRDDGFDAFIAKPFAVRIAVVGAVGLYSLGFAAGSSALAAHLGNCGQKGFKLRDVVSVGAGEYCRQGNAAGVGDEMMFASRLRAIRWIWTAFFPPRPRSGRLKNRQRRGTSLSNPLPAIEPAERHEALPTHRLPATCEAVANKSCQNRSPSPWADTPTGCPSVKRTKDPSSTCDWKAAFARDAWYVGPDRAGAMAR